MVDCFKLKTFLVERKNPFTLVPNKKLKRFLYERCCHKFSAITNLAGRIIKCMDQLNSLITYGMCY